EYLDSIKEDYIITREPGGSKIAEKIRSIILDSENSSLVGVCELMLYLAARAQHVNDIIKPSLRQGKLVICDRYTDSTLAYQGYARGLGVDMVNTLNNYAVSEFMPTLTIFLDYPPELAFKRKGGADKTDRLENLDINFHKKVYEGYKKIAQTFSQRFFCIDASGSKDLTFGRIINLLKEKNIIKA
ncbi:MAG: dTMP kinase, partial [Clostridia bacterium]|nr:dTMP kinase [Clostridia bacterium]